MDDDIPDLEKLTSDWESKGGGKKAAPDTEQRRQELLTLFKERSKPIDPDILSTRPEGPEHLWGSYVTRRTVSILASLGGLGKSQLALMQALRLACGLSFLGRGNRDGPMRTWYVSLEDPPEVVNTRVHDAVNAIVESQKAKNRAKYEPPGLSRAQIHELVLKNFRYLDMYGEQFKVARKEASDIIVTGDLDALAEHIEAEGGTDQVIVDTLVRSHALAENLNEEMSQVIIGYERFARRLNAGVLLAAHMPKAAVDKNGHGGSHGARGAGAITDNARSSIIVEAATVAEMKKFENVPEKWLDPKNPRLLNVRNAKVNFGAREPVRYAALQQGWVEEFTPVLGKANADERDYAMLYQWWSSDRGYRSKPLTKNAIKTNLEGLREFTGSGAGRPRWEALLDWAVENGHATEVSVEGNRSDAKFLKLIPPGTGD